MELQFTFYIWWNPQIYDVYISACINVSRYINVLYVCIHELKIYGCIQLYLCRNVWAHIHTLMIYWDHIKDCFVGTKRKKQITCPWICFQQCFLRAGLAAVAYNNVKREPLDKASKKCITRNVLFPRKIHDLSRRGYINQSWSFQRKWRVFLSWPLGYARGLPRNH